MLKRKGQSGHYFLLGVLGLNLACYTLPVYAAPAFQISRVSTTPRTSTHTIIHSKNIELTKKEKQVGVVTLNKVMPIFEKLNREKNLYSAKDFNYFMRNFHYPNRRTFDVTKKSPPSHIVLHWTANSAPYIPLYTLSAFMRSRQRGRIRERPNRYKNVSNYFLTGTVRNLKGKDETFLIKMTRGYLPRWGDIPRVTAYPTGESWDDNKYDGRGAIGIEIGSPHFRYIYHNKLQRDQLHNFILLVLSERGVLSEFKALRRSPHWGQMQALHKYLIKNLDKIDVNKRGGVPLNYRHMDEIIKNFPDFSPQLYGEITKIFRFISGHGIVAREYIERMLKSGRPKDARYDRADFTEPHVFVIAMEFLNSDMRYRGVNIVDLETLRYIDATTKQQLLLLDDEMKIPDSATQPPEKSPWYRFEKR